MSSSTAILQLICPDRIGLVSELSGWIASHSGNILTADHHIDEEAGLFLSRIEWDLREFVLDRELMIVEINNLAKSLNGKAQLNFSDQIPRVAIFASKQSHCLLDLLWRQRSGELRMNVTFVISNHKDLESICIDNNVMFKYIPITESTRSIAEREMLDLLNTYKIELIVLAKYMKLLSPAFLEEFSNIINIHHSFLPAFKGSKPYHRAWNRGVKLIGATAHYVTEELDNGPIIEQTVTKVTHRDDINDLIRKGRDTERIALSRALRLHLQRKVMIYQARTAIFS